MAAVSALSETEALKIPPHSIEAEQAVLGGLMLSPESWDRVADKINERDFYRRDHQIIFRAISELAGKDQPFDAVTLGAARNADGGVWTGHVGRPASSLHGRRPGASTCSDADVAGSPPCARRWLGRRM